MQMTYNLTDMFWLGRMKDSVIAVASSGLAGLFMWFGMALLIIGRMGAEIGTSQNIGRRDMETAKAYGQNAARLSLILGIIYGSILLVFARPLVIMLQVKEPKVIANASSYLRIISAGIPITYLSAAITGSFNGSGNSRLGFIANGAGLLVNMILIRL